MLPSNKTNRPSTTQAQTLLPLLPQSTQEQLAAYALLHIALHQHGLPVMSSYTSLPTSRWYHLYILHTGKARGLCAPACRTPPAQPPFSHTSLRQRPAAVPSAWLPRVRCQPKRQGVGVAAPAPATTHATRAAAATAAAAATYTAAATAAATYTAAETATATYTAAAAAAAAADGRWTGYADGLLWRAVPTATGQASSRDAVGSSEDRCNLACICL